MHLQTLLLLHCSLYCCVLRDSSSCEALAARRKDESCRDAQVFLAPFPRRKLEIVQTPSSGRSLQHLRQAADTSNFCRVSHSHTPVPRTKLGMWTRYSLACMQGMAGSDYYEILGVSKTASKEEIKEAYYRLVKHYHPDMNQGNFNAEKFHVIQNAYEVLRDDTKRSMFDQVGINGFEQMASNTYGSNPSPGFQSTHQDMQDIFEGVPEVKVVLQLSFMEAIQGCRKSIPFQASSKCESCRGSGIPPGSRPQTCKLCKGTGMKIEYRQGYVYRSPCLSCRGSGCSVKDRCAKCQGKRVTMADKNLCINIPAGVDSNAELRVPGEGNFDSGSGQLGHVVVALKVTDSPIFKRCGADIHTDAIVSFTMAILGGKVRVPTLTRDVLIKVPQGTQHGQMVCIRRGGVKILDSQNFGDLFVHFRVTIPTYLSERQMLLIEELLKEERRDEDAAAAGGII